MLAEAFDMGVHEVASSLVRSQSGIVIHTCAACGAQFDRAAFRRCHLLVTARAPDGRAQGMEWRNCGCGGTFAVDTEILDAP